MDLAHIEHLLHARHLIRVSVSVVLKICSWISSMNIIWELVGNADSQTHSSRPAASITLAG